MYNNKETMSGSKAIGDFLLPLLNADTPTEVTETEIHNSTNMDYQQIDDAIKNMIKYDEIIQVLPSRFLINEGQDKEKIIDRFLLREGNRIVGIYYGKTFHNILAGRPPGKVRYIMTEAGQPQTETRYQFSNDIMIQIKPPLTDYIYDNGKYQVVIDFMNKRRQYSESAPNEDAERLKCYIKENKLSFENFEKYERYMYSGVKSEYKDLF